MLVLDAYNVLHASEALPPEYADIEIPELVALLGRSRYAGTPTTLVCDGVRPGAGHAGPSATTIGDCRMLYAGGGREADDEIERLLGATSFASRILVVSSDKRIQRAARRAGAHWTRSATFMGELARDLARKRREPLPKWVHEIPLGPAGVEHWMREFGLPEDWGPRVEAARAMPEPGVARVDPVRESEPPPAGPPRPPLDEATRRLIEEHAIDPDDLDMGRWVGD